jgi:hypothetical protein
MLNTGRLKTRNWSRRLQVKYTIWNIRKFRVDSESEVKIVVAPAVSEIDSRRCTRNRFTSQFEWKLMSRNDLRSCRWHETHETPEKNNVESEYEVRKEKYQVCYEMTRKRWRHWLCRDKAQNEGRAQSKTMNNAPDDKYGLNKVRTHMCDTFPRFGVRIGWELAEIDLQ